MAIGRYTVSFRSCFIILLIGSGSTQRAIVATEDATGILGNQISVVCDFSTQGGETIAFLSLERQRDGDSNAEIARFFPSSNSFDFVGNDTSLQNRAQLTLTVDSARLRIDRVICSDEAVYRCTLSVTDSGMVQDGMTLQVVAPPQTPTMSVSRNTSYENEYVEIDCRANVGRPAGNMVWYSFRSNGQVLDMTPTAGISNPSLAPDSCSYTRSSTLGLQVSRLDNGVVIRCVVSHEITGSDPPPEASCTGACSERGPLEVLYPVLQGDINITLSPMMDIYSVGSNVMLTCVSNGNPKPGYIWFRGQEVIATWPQLYLHRLQKSDLGTYLCNASNVLNYIRHSTTSNVNIVVGKGSTLNTGHVLSICVMAEFLKQLLHRQSTV